MPSIACQHHVSWVIEVDPGIHRCIQCFEQVQKKQLTPRFEELSEEFRRDWDDFEAGGHPAAPYPHSTTSH